MSISRPYVILVGGGTASGKSTIVQQFVEESGAAYLGHDRYYFDVQQPRGHDFDHPDALDTDRLIKNLEQLKAGQPADLPVYDFASHSRTNAVETMHPSAIIVVEGILVLSDARLVALADTVVFVDAPESVRLARRLQRDVADRGRTEESVMDQYTSTVKPNHDHFVEPTKALADLVLDGTASVSESVRQLRTTIP